jgi:D-glycerate 3-kinase
MALGAKTIDDMCFGLNSICIPRYNKSAYEGKGDRAEEDTWIEGPLDLVIVEGWMLGFQPVEKPTPEMEKVNELLSKYVKWEDRIDAAIIISAADNNYVYQWRE